jgi:NADH:ubiquinone oxidoreductase subunit E
MDNEYKQILEEEGLTEQISVEGCDCQGECGYGPNLVVDGTIVNNVKGRDAVLSALGIE